ncbi:ABC transporter ATP-binding protein [Streptomyces rapamycinicus]|uniref:Spermidine/putrescine ABC transporter ATP-binding protein n=2 Tax=Streptomyces rapamycinicus TaxID=1226757 RepID=A0A0A0N7S0_STRRN|nr:ABC transporter ATP-binding protein [Streptomyces rapamycinicus]AGP52038.1 spermidine/putrescine ABC transporter ATP-binding protein [Streptomyces rapamycinicus NRRL 5491]MBB4779471.1 spermidine/putrescine transport system ATP-binding protein/putrescine transport system ATP-binding protein [Streptomyces rapamycinicus]RLV75866.1 spermidine/putrescine ABC transporter ATP-binding protein [Streptomyces rapamycinicus NRRL 5491]UTP28241.1 ABC transporter ATP-binding protein [Streptomyces rapamycin
MIRIHAVTRRFGEVTALDGVSLEIAEGEFFALLGPSDCGKTTLLRVLAGFEAPDSGTVTLDGRGLLAVPAHRRPVNLMFQSYALFPHMSVEKNIAYGPAREGLARAEIGERVAAVLATVGLTTRARRRPHQLSGGQRQRVALARAIVKRPRVLLLDEPLSALDKQVRAEMQLELKRLQHEVGITFLVVTHDQEEAMSLADRIAVLDAGRVQQVDTPVELYRHPRGRFVAGLVGANNVFSGRLLPSGGLDVPGVGVLPAPAGKAAGLVGVRPESIRLAAQGADAYLRGTVLDISYFGGSSRIAITVPGLDRPVLLTVPGPATVVSGARVALSWDPESAVLIETTGDTP